MQIEVAFKFTAKTGGSWNSSSCNFVDDNADQQAIEWAKKEIARIKNRYFDLTISEIKVNQIYFETCNRRNIAELDICSLCGEVYVKKEYSGHIGFLMDRDNICFDCAFWIEKLDNRNEDTFIVDGVHYIGQTLSQEEYKKAKNECGGFGLGFGGREFYVLFAQNPIRCRYYNNVWCQGDVPKKGPLAEKFKNNAIFISKEDYEKYSKYINK